MATNFREKTTPLWKILYNSFIMIIIFVIVGAILGFGASKILSKPVYTASQTVILRMEITEENSGNENADNASLAKIYLPDVAAIIKSPKIERLAQEKYGDGTKISRNSVSVTYGEKSMIFTIAYSDSNLDIAEEKLSCIIEVTTDFFIDAENSKVIEAKNVSLVKVQNGVNVSKSTQTLTFTGVGAVVGLVLAVLVAILVHMFDNTVKDIEEFENMTGVSVLSHVEK